ncbi:MAG TPA: peptidyl-prolyl cis-trans isomerase [Candidatus Eisenbacteria bacterium]|nr:peptidyl-prolyl cis-trans isomerase [Candidatus Eisenbacteria bacterium]
MHRNAHARSSMRKARLVALGAILALSALNAPAAPAPRAKTSAATKKAAPTSASKVQHAADLPPYTPPPLAPGDTLLAKVGDRNITLRSFRAEWAELDPNQRPNQPDPFLAYKAFLNDIVTRELMAVEATKHAKPLSPQQRSDLDSLWHVYARNQLYLEEIQRRVTVDPSQVERYRKELSKILYLTAYVFPTQESAQSWYTRIVSGTPVSRLEAAAKEGGSDAPRIIDLGHKIREDFDESTSKVLFALAPGRMSPPVPTKEGWALIQLTEVRPRPNAYSQASDAAVLHEMTRIKSVSYKEVYRDSLSKALHIAYDEAAMDTLLNRFLLLDPRTSRGESGTMNYSWFQPMPTFRSGDMDLVLATTDQGRVTGADLYRYLLGMGDIARPEIRSLDQMRPWVDRVAFDHALLERAMKMGYDYNPHVLRQVQKAREFDLISALYEDSVSAKVKISEQDVRAAYDRDPARWVQEETVSAWICALPTKAQAESLIMVGKAGGNLKDLAYQFTQLGEFAANGGMTQPFTRSQCPIPAATDSVFNTPVGSFGGPIPSPEGYDIWKVVARTPARSRPLEEVHDDVARLLRNEREEAAMQLFLARLAKRIPVQKHEQLLGKVAPIKS